MARREVLTTAELTRLGLADDPFGARGAAAFFDGGGRGKQLEQLAYFTEWARAVIVVTGVSDAGKSTLCAALANALPHGSRVALLTGGILTPAGELLARIAHGLGMPLPAELDGAALTAGIVEYAAAAQDADGYASVVLLDDAHELAPDCVRALADLAVQALERRALNIVLFAEPSFIATLHGTAAEFGPEFTWHEIALAPFTLNDTRAYLHSRLEHAGLEGRLPLSESAIQDLQRKSGGLPGRIDHLAVAALRRAARARKSPWRTRGGAIVAGVAGALLLAAAVIAWRGGGSTVVVDEAPPGPPEGALGAPAEGEVNEQHSATAELAGPSLGAVADDGDEATTADPAVHSIGVEAPAAAAPIADRPERRLDGAAWLRAQPASNYTVQVVGLSSSAALDRFMSRQPDGEPFVAWATARAGKPWFVVYYGSFETRNAALAAARALPASVGKVQPWVRRFGDIQAQLR